MDLVNLCKAKHKIIDSMQDISENMSRMNAHLL